MRFQIGLGVLLLAAFAAGAEPLPDATYMAPARLVPVDGARRLNLVCMGKGSPAVLFDSGLGDGILSWRLVQGEIAKVTRACAYERAGVGFSDPRSDTSDAKAIVTDLHAMLAAARITTPVLYVGHSVAGLYGVLLQAMHPEDLAGAVLVDPSFANQFDVGVDAAIAAGAPPAMRAMALASYHKDVDRLRECAQLPAPLPEDCVQTDTRLSPSLATFQKMQESRPSYLLTQASEYEALLPTITGKGLDQTEIEAAAPSFGAKPLIVLTHGIAPVYPGLNAAQNAAIDQSWMAGHDKLAALSRHGSNTVVPDSHHAIERDNPQTIIDAITKALTEIRGR